MKMSLYILALVGVFSFSAEIFAKELEDIKAKKALSFSSGEIQKYQNSDGKYLAKRGYYTKEDYAKQISEIEGAIAFFAYTGELRPAYYNVLFKDNKGYFFKQYKYSSKDKKLIISEDYKAPNENIYLKESAVLLLLDILKTALTQAKETGRFGLDGGSYEFAMLIDGKWQKAGAWTPVEGTTPFKLMNCVYMYNQVNLENCLKNFLGEALYKTQTLKEKYTKDGILLLEINESYELDTRASIYHKYKTKQLSFDYIYLNSSDIGDYIFCRDSLNKWNKFFTRILEIKGTNIYIIFPENKRNNKEAFNLIHILFEKNGILEKIELKGEFFMYEKFFTTQSDSLVINNGTELLYFDTKSKL